MSKKNPDAMSQWSDFKRLAELCYADPEYTRGFLSDPEEKLSEAGLSLDVATAKEAIEILLNNQDLHVADSKENYYINLMNHGIKSVHAAISDRTGMENFTHEVFRAWYQRQKNSVLFSSFILRKKMRIFYIPISFELTKGCSGACPFCCLAPKKLEECFYYNRENARLWQGILGRTKEIIGNAAASGVCYFATEPFDNPDYEKFIDDFYYIFGYYPQTTTARALDNINRTKYLLHMLGDKHLRQAAVRFSIVSKSQLEDIHRAFTPKELAYVELLLNNPESMYRYSLAGRALKLRKGLPEKKFIPEVTSVCTIGFVVNMPERTVALIAPRNKDPCGMRVYEKAAFADESSYTDLLHELIARWMEPGIPLDKKLNIDFEHERNGNYLTVRGDKIHRTISASEEFYKCFIETSKGETLTNIFRTLELTEFQRQQALTLMQVLYDSGYVDVA